MAGGDTELWQMRVRGLVQGVGFRPTVWRLAVDAGLSGDVLNDAEGVLIRLSCSRDRLDRFAKDLRANMPPLARIDGIEIARDAGRLETKGFAIAASAKGVARTGILPDAATCRDCLDDITDPRNRRFRYAFTNCTNCGPRVSITRAIPYDRQNTAMAAFRMCVLCQKEYDDPANRRFHAQPNACPDCGPQLALVDRAGKPVAGDPIELAAGALMSGKILAIKGLGGFQLACDATSTAVVDILRSRKRRVAKPFALMARDLDQVACFVRLPAAAKAALTSAEAPIVLAERRGNAPPLAAGIAPGQNRLGFMLPNTPLHHLLLDQVGGPLVMTSGNLSNEPQVIDNDTALSRLGAIADLWLRHDRDIVNRLDDSVVQIMDGETRSLRRARGFAPAPLPLHPGFARAQPVLACGADLKNTFCLLKDGMSVVSQHMGDMENTRSHRDFRENLGLYSETHDFTPATVAVDAHPGYFSARIGAKLAALHDAQLIEVQHHHAHVAATLAEHGHGPDTQPVLGVVLDGSGYGADGTIWGGEFLLADFRDYRRLAHFAPLALAGGEQATQQPWRNTFAHLLAVYGPDPLAKIERQYGALPILKDLRAKPTAMLAQMIEAKLNAPLASSAGRLFDAVAAALGICFDQIDFEGQAAMHLQSMAEQHPKETGAYPVKTGPILEWHGLWHGLLADIAAAVPAPVIAARFHNSLCNAVLGQVHALSELHQYSAVVLTGGVFQNRLLLTRIKDGLIAQGFEVLTPRRFPANDGGISLGQATVTAARAGLTM